MNRYYKAISRWLTTIDVISAKAKYAKSMSACLPELVEDQSMYLRDAFHPLLYLTNLENKKKTFPQTISLSLEHRIVVYFRS